MGEHYMIGHIIEEAVVLVETVVAVLVVVVEEAMVA